MFSQTQHRLITGGTFSTITPLSDMQTRAHADLAFQRLEKATAHAGFHNSIDRSDPPRCHPRTRLAIQAQIKAWALRDLEPDIDIMWLTGGAGAGKSAIAQCMAELFEKEGRLAAGFFFGRSDAARNDGRKLIATLASQLCINIAGFRDLVESAINHDPFIFTRSLASQMKSLITDPLQQLQINGNIDPTHLYAVIIDGLDECQSRDVQCNILITIADAISQTNLPLRFLVASRPESHITSTFLSRKMARLHTRRILDETLSPDDDIEIYLRDLFEEIKETHVMRSYVPSNWPSNDNIYSLVRKASGQFIYPSIVVKYVQSSRRVPIECLDNILGLRPISHDNPFAELDRLYQHILGNVEDIEMVMKILSFLILAPPHWSIPGTVHSIEYFLGLSRGEIRFHLDSLTSIITYGEVVDSDQKLSISHASLGDFLQDQTRSAHLYMDPPVRSNALAQRCIHHMTDTEPVYHDGDFISHTLPEYAKSQSYGYSQYAVLDLVANSILTQELCVAISEFSIFKTYTVSRQISAGPWEDFNAFGMWKFIKLIEHLNLEDKKAITEIIGQHYADAGFTTAMAIVNLNSVRPLTPRIYHGIRELLFHIADDNPSPEQKFDVCQFSFFFPLINGPYLARYRDGEKAYTSCFRGCFSEREKKAMHPMDHKKYTVGATNVLQFLSSEYVLKNNSKFLPCYSCHDLSIRRRRPWKWSRKRFELHGTLTWTRLYHWRTLKTRPDGDVEEEQLKRSVNTNVLRQDGPYTLYSEQYNHSVVYEIVINSIPRLLRRSDHDLKLIQLAKTISFPFQLISFKRERAALVAINKYLSLHLPNSIIGKAKPISTQRYLNLQHHGHHHKARNASSSR